MLVGVFGLAVSGGSFKTCKLGRLSPHMPPLLTLNRQLFQATLDTKLKRRERTRFYVDEVRHGLMTVINVF